MDPADAAHETDTLLKTQNLVWGTTKSPEVASPPSGSVYSRAALP